MRKHQAHETFCRVLDQIAADTKLNPWQHRSGDDATWVEYWYRKARKQMRDGTSFFYVIGTIRSSNKRLVEPIRMIEGINWPKLPILVGRALALKERLEKDGYSVLAVYGPRTRPLNERKYNLVYFIVGLVDIPLSM